MKKNCLLILLFIVSICNAQEKSYRFVYDFHQQVVLNEESKKGYDKDFFSKINDALNRSYEFDLLSSKDFSFIKLREKIKNGQTEDVITLEPDLSWCLIDFDRNEIYKYNEVIDVYIKDSIQTLQLKPTKNKKTILGREVKEFLVETDNIFYSFWLARQNGTTISPIEYQFKDYIVFEIDIAYKRKSQLDTKMEQQYILKEIEESKNSIDYNKLKPKKTVTVKEFKELSDKVNKNSDQSVDRE